MPVGTLVLPDPSDVRLGVQYGADGDEYTGTLEVPTPSDTPLFRTPFAAILNNVVTQVSYALKIGRQYVRPVASDDYAVTETEDLFAYIRPFSPEPGDPGSGFPQGNQGAGRLCKTVIRRIRVYIWTRSGEDVYGGDEIALLGNDPNQLSTDTPVTLPGLHVSEEIVLNALDDYMVVNASGDPLTVGPLHWIPSDGGPPKRKAENSEGLVWASLDFQAVYNLAYASGDPQLQFTAPSGI